MNSAFNTGSVAWMAGIVVSAGLLLPFDSRAEEELAGAFAASWDQCAAATYAVERETRIPKSLLTAISLAESGRRDDLNKTNVAWPWTVTSGSRQWYLDSKSEAVAHVRSMIRDGERNIDVGCMQVNLYYHGDAFASLEDAFDPLSNVSYAASYLSRLRTSTADWLTAAGNYHSATPEFHRRYKKKITEIWTAERRAYASNAEKAYDRAGLLFVSADVPPIDQVRTDELNAAFKRRQTAGSELFTMTQNPDGARQSLPGAVDGSDWQTAYLLQAGQGNNYTLQAQINRVRKTADRKRMIDDAANARENISADKRASDLDKWRARYSEAVNGPSMLQVLSGGLQ